ncbi:GNAT family N-acetyltransferase [Streptomyces sp. NBC_00083]|uniref:GNAT family N-acetyltransferase n=1 Tax=Streptomyces sp. NBC_00083 TaxID=2975647 RepID=UPI002259B9FA|nr:GNAT family N-acetyltransferase [Streptomyces sp. NBC_00083]MCX5382697.1 GNAT family N-acetyltransferase [Streptomyces sp. NBC_00083]
MTVTVGRAGEADAGVIAVLLGEIEAYYGGSPAPGDLGRIRAALFCEHPAATVLLAREGDDVLGFASYSRLWPASGADTSLYLKELYVRESARRRGVAGMLMARLREEATAAGCTRVEWTADLDNPPALAFYAALGAVPRDGKVLYRVGK